MSGQSQRVVIVIGGSSGMSAVTVLLLAAAGVTFLINYSRHGALTDAVAPDRQAAGAESLAMQHNAAAEPRRWTLPR